MNKKTVFGFLGVLALIASAAMYKIGNSNSHLTELKDFWWVPAPLGLLLIILAGRTANKS